VAIARKKSKRGKRLKDPGDLPLALRVYLHVLAGERPLDELPRICNEDVFVEDDEKERVQGIEAVRELIAFRRDHLAGPPIGVKRMVDHGHDDIFGQCVRVDFTIRTRAVAGKTSNAKRGEPLFLFVMGMYYLGDDGRITQIYEQWPELFRLTRVAR
jgi:hypothetical protein